jgi:hypothetical protein
LQVSFVGCGSGENEKIAFNYGRELFVYPYRGIRKSSEAKLLDKRVYKVRKKNNKHIHASINIYVASINIYVASINIHVASINIYILLQ